MANTLKEWAIRGDENLPLAVVEVDGNGESHEWHYECDHYGARRNDAAPWQLALAQLLVALPADERRIEIADMLYLAVERYDSDRRNGR